MRTVLDHEVAGGNVGPGDGRVPPDFGKRAEETVLPGIKEIVFRHRAGADKARHAAFHHCLVSACLRVGRAFELFADGDAKPLADKGLKVTVSGVVRHAAHRDSLTAMHSALGERDIQGFGRGNGVVEEHLVEIAHAIEQQGPRMFGLDLVILGHHRCYCQLSVRHEAPRRESGQIP